MNLFDLAAKINLDSSEYEKGLEKSEKQTNDFAKSLKNGLRTAAKIAGAALAAVATKKVIDGFKEGISNVAEYGDRIDKMSQKIGFSTKGFQEWDYILNQSGTSMESVQRGMISLEQAAKNGSGAFEKLGISQEQLASMNQEELWDATIKGLQGVADGGERARLAEELFGKGARELAPLLNMTAEETEAMKKQVNDLGGVMSDDAVKSAAAYGDSLDNLKTTLGGLKNKLFSEFLPGLTSVMDGLTMIFSGDSEGGVAQVSAGIQDMVKNISEGLPKVLEVGGQILSGLSDAIIENLPTIIESGTEILLNLLTGILKAIPQLIEKVPEIIKAIVDGLAAAGPELLEAGKKIIDAIWEGLESKWESVKGWFKGIGSGIKDFFSSGSSGNRGGEGFDINWHAKAYDTPYMFNRPTVVNGMGFGDGAGAEMVYGHDSLMRDIRQAAGGGQNIMFSPTININGDIQDPREKAEELMREMKLIFDREAAAYGA